MTAVKVRLSEPWTVVGVHPLPPGWANVFKNAETGVMTVEPCPALLVQSSEHRRRLVYATCSPDDELVAANDRPDYVVTTADWALALRRNGAGYGRVQIQLPPPDVVPHSEITPVVADLLAGAVGTQITVHWPGEPIESMDGELLGMTEPRTVTATLARLHITDKENRDDDPTG